MNLSQHTINLHPPGAQLQQFVAGELSPGLSVAVSAHLELCNDCKIHSAELESELAANWSDLPEDFDIPGFDEMLDQITRQPQQLESSPPKVDCQEIRIDNRTIPIPKVLGCVAGDNLAWKKLPGGIRQAQVRLDDSTKCEFIYMSPGSKAPAHTHRGNEVMLVLDGRFSDELGDYEPADFVVRDPSHQHQPRTEQGCLCFSVLDSPLIFTEGFLRFLNPFNRWMFLKSYWYR